MDLYKEILIEMLLNEQTDTNFTSLQVDLENALNSKCYTALNQIKSIIGDDSLSDNESYNKIEAIVNLFKQFGIDSGNRHNII